MKTIMVNNDQQFLLALRDAQSGDTIELLPGEYLLSKKTLMVSIKKNLTIQGQYSNARATKLNCAFLVGSNVTLLLKNLFVTYCDTVGNTIALYDHSELFGQNLIVDRTNNQAGWDTIYAQNSIVSFLNSDILAERSADHIGLSLENSQMMLVDTNVYLLNLKNSIGYVKDSLVSYAIVLQKHSQLTFVDMAIDSNQSNQNSDFYITDNSTVDGVNLKLSKKEPFIDVIQSSFKNDIFTQGLDGIRWCFDDESVVLADGREPYNTGL